MKHKYCPSCGSMDIKNLSNGMEECVRCKFRGEFREGAMDEINSFRKSLKSGLGSAVSGLNKAAPSGSPSALKDKLNSLKGKKTDDFEIL